MDVPARDPFIRWFKRFRPDVVIGHASKAIDWMAECGARVPETHGFVCLNTVFQDRPCSGLDLQPSLLAARAIEMLIAQVQRGELGIPNHPSITGIPGQWIDGPTLRTKVV
jgi:LacI family transcriptional regulator